MEYLTIICRRQSEDCGIIHNIFTEPEENNCFSIVAQVIIRANSFFFSSEPS